MDETFDQGKLLELEGVIRQQNPGYRIQGDLGDFLSGQFGITTIVFFIAGVLIVIYSLSAGIGLMTSGGNPSSVQSNKAKLTNALVGFLILLASYWIVQIVGTVLGLEGITNTFSPNN